jgi:hypothetical protein
MSKTDKFGKVIMKMMESVTLDDNDQMVIIDEVAHDEASDLLSQLVVETARDWWSQLESSENSLANMADEISFAEMNTDPSHISTPALNIAADEPTIESMLEDEDFDLDEMLEMDGDDFGPADGDDEFDDLMSGNDEGGMGDDMGGDDLDMDGDMDAIGGEMDGDDYDMDAEMDGGEEASEFNFDFLDDEEADLDAPEMDDEMEEDQGNQSGSSIGSAMAGGYQPNQSGTPIADQFGK